jgi:hypothetical protein
MYSMNGFISWLAQFSVHTRDHGSSLSPAKLFRVMGKTSRESKREWCEPVENIYVYTSTWEARDDILFFIVAEHQLS